MIRRIARLFQRGDRIENAAPPSALIVGLGNPGPEYEDTRHNIGVRVVEALAARHHGVWQDDRSTRAKLCHVSVDGQSVALLAPQTFMNRSGESVALALDRWPSIEPSTDLLVVYDDLDLPTGRIRLRPSGGAGGHNGMGDILEQLATREVARLRFGIGHPGSASLVTDWVLRPFEESEERDVLPQAVERAVDALEAALREGVRSAMSHFNAARADPE